VACVSSRAAAWPWSSAAAHCGTADPDACLEMSTWRQSWSEASWRKFLEERETESELRAIRRSTYSGRPLGPKAFTQALERQTLRRLTPGARGRPRKTPADVIRPLTPKI
jgi:putative transposase